MKIDYYIVIRDDIPSVRPSGTIQYQTVRAPVYWTTATQSVKYRCFARGEWHYIGKLDGNGGDYWESWFFGETDKNSVRFGATGCSRSQTVIIGQDGWDTDPSWYRGNIYSSTTSNYIEDKRSDDYYILNAKLLKHKSPSYIENTLESYKEQKKKLEDKLS